MITTVLTETRRRRRRRHRHRRRRRRRRRHTTTFEDLSFRGTNVLATVLSTPVACASVNERVRICPKRPTNEQKSPCKISEPEVYINLYPHTHTHTHTHTHKYTPEATPGEPEAAAGTDDGAAESEKGVCWDLVAVCACACVRAYHEVCA
jgi:hypothetical protein